QHAAKSQQQSRQRIIPADQIVLVKEKIAEDDQHAPPETKWCVTQNDESRSSRQQHMQHLHRSNVCRETAEHEQQKIPKKGVTFVTRIVHELARRCAVAREQPVVRFIQPELVPENSGKAQRAEQKHEACNHPPFLPDAHVETVSAPDAFRWRKSVSMMIAME